MVGSAATLGPSSFSWAAETLPRMIVTRDPNCGCCAGWIAHVKAARFPVDVIEAADLAPLKAKLGVPESLAACHTAEVGGYVVEGHVPADAIKQLLAERPQAQGLAVPGMPIGSPGMEVAGTPPETYKVILFGATEQRVFGRYRGSQKS
jgi:hypothetical protein